MLVALALSMQLLVACEVTAPLNVEAERCRVEEQCPHAGMVCDGRDFGCEAFANDAGLVYRCSHRSARPGPRVFCARSAASPTSANH
jgi:hypothetical protein